MLNPEEIAKIRAEAGASPVPISSGISLSEQLGISEQSSPYQEKVVTPLAEFSKGVVKGALETTEGLGKLGLRGAEIITGKEKGELGSQETFFEDKTALEPKTPAEEVGKFTERVAEFAIPGSKIAKATQKLSFLPKLLARSVGSGAVATAQEGEIGKETAIAAGTEALLPIAGKVIAPALNVGRRLIKSLASGLSGVSSKAIDAMVSEPSVSKQIAKDIDLSGQTETLKKNAGTIISGISKIRQQARTAYGEAIGALRAEDIKPKVFRDSVSPILNKFGVTQIGGKQVFKNVEFSDPKNLKIAQTLVNKLSKVKLDGYSLRKLLNEIDEKAYKIATTDERLSFNAFVRELSDSVKGSISKSTDKLSEINKVYSTDLQLTGAMEGIFGKVKFKNLNEIRKVSERLDTLFSKKGLSPEIIDDFLTRVGVKPSEFNASEAVRQITDVGLKSNTEGLSISEIIRGITSSVITPKAVRDLSVMTGLAEQNLLPILQKLNPVARGALIELLTQFNEE